MISCKDILKGNVILNIDMLIFLIQMGGVYLNTFMFFNWTNLGNWKSGGQFQDIRTVGVIKYECINDISCLIWHHIWQVRST